MKKNLRIKVKFLGFLGRDFERIKTKKEKICESLSREFNFKKKWENIEDFIFFLVRGRKRSERLLKLYRIILIYRRERI